MSIINSTAVQLVLLGNEMAMGYVSRMGKWGKNHVENVSVKVGSINILDVRADRIV